MGEVYYCQCGCGQESGTYRRTHSQRGQFKGVPRRFILGHNSRGEAGPKNKAWRGGRQIDGKGYVLLWDPVHPCADAKGYVYEHIAKAVAALGHLLPAGAVVHHIDEDRQNNANTNLIILPSRGYHFSLHWRMRRQRRT